MTDKDFKLVKNSQKGIERSKTVKMVLKCRNWSKTVKNLLNKLVIKNDKTFLMSMAMYNHA